MDQDPGFRYLNLENRWPGFNYVSGGLALRNDGSLGLAPLPWVGGAAVTLSSAVRLNRAETGPAGLAADSAGMLYVTDPAVNQVLRCNPCDGTCEPLPCIGAQEDRDTGLRAPRGLIIGAEGVLYLIDSGNHCLRMLDPTTFQTIGILGQANPFGTPIPSAKPGCLDTPWAIVADSLGRLYVLDCGNRRVQRFDAAGRVDGGFWETLRVDPSAKLGEPVAIALGRLDGEERILILDRSPKQLLLCGLDGRIDVPAMTRWHGALEQSGAGLDSPATLAIIDDNVLVGDATRPTLLAFDTRGHLRGPVEGLRAPVAAFAISPRGGELWVYQAAAGIVSELILGDRYRPSGGFLAGPFAVSDRPTRWHSLRAGIEPLPMDAHMRLYSLTSDRGDGSGRTRPTYPWLEVNRPAAFQAGDPNPAPLDTWRALPMDAADGLILNDAGRYLWIAGVFQGDGKHTPVLRQLRVDFEHEGWLRHLPETYRRPADQAPLDRMLALFEHSLDDLSATIDALPARLSPRSAPDPGPTSWLEWLGGWIGVELDENWSERQRRQAVSDAFALHGRRGTPDALREQLARHGFTVRIDEPGQEVGPWSLGEASPLGFTTMLAPAHADGAVLGSTAIPGQADLIPSDEYGAPLFRDLANRFRVGLYASERLDGEVLSRLRQLLDREKPAHTCYELYVIEPCMRVGVQARVGVDSVVAGPLPPARLDTERSLGSRSILDVAPGTLSGRTLDNDTVLGQDIRVE